MRMQERERVVRCFVLCWSDSSDSSTEFRCDSRRQILFMKILFNAILVTRSWNAISFEWRRSLRSLSRLFFSGAFHCWVRGCGCVRCDLCVMVMVMGFVTAHRPSKAKPPRTRHSISLAAQIIKTCHVGIIFDRPLIGSCCIKQHSA